MRQWIGRRILGISEWIASPKGTRTLAGPFLYGRVKVRAFDILVQDARSILIVRLDTIGDLVLMSPFIRELRRLNPNAWITLGVDPRFVNLIELCPAVNAVVTFESCYNVSGRRSLELHFRALRLARKHFWKRQFDLA